MFDRKNFSGKKIFLTGSSGFLGTNLINKLNTLNSNIYLIKRPQSIRHGNEIKNNISILKIDLTDLNETISFIKKYKPDFIFHLAANSDVNDCIKNPYESISYSSLSILNILEAVRKFSKNTKIGKNVVIEPYVVFGKKVKIGNNVNIKSFSHLENCKVENKVDVGPYARIRPGVTLKENSKIGNFVEIKKSIIGKKSKVNHLSYVGDSNIGKYVNIGAGTITCNYDGVKKSKTKIKNNVFIGSNSSLVAPITIEEDSVIGAGSVITKNVKKKSLALTRSLQTEIRNYKRKKK